MFPVLLDDSSLANEFQIFLQAIDDSYEVTLSTDQQYPVLSFSTIYFNYNFLQHPLLTVETHTMLCWVNRECLHCFSSAAVKLEQLGFV